MAKLYVFAWDGVSFDLLRPWMDEGRLPNLRALIDEGASGPLPTVFPPVTATSWSSFATGTNPGSHGIFDMTLLRRDGALREEAASAHSLHGRTLWDLAAQHGLRSIVVNLPPTWPPKPMEGALVADFLAPQGDRRLSWPPELIDEIEQRFGPYRLHFKKIYRKGGIGELLDEAREVFRYKLGVVEHLTRTRDWDLVIHHVFGSDRLQHELWHVLDPSHPAHDPEEGAAWAPKIADYFDELDAAIPRIRKWLGVDGTICLLSDHGFGPVHRYLVLNCWLLERGYLVLRKGALSRIRAALFRSGFTPDLAYRIADKLGLGHLRHSGGIGTRHKQLAFVSNFFLSFADVDWSRTVAYSKGNFGQIYMNVRGREPEGILDPGEEYEAARTRIISDLAALTEPGGRELLFESVWRREELYRGELVDRAPDILFLPKDMRWKALGVLDFIANSFVLPNFGQSGDHRMDGMFTIAGPSIRRGHRITEAHMLDVAPTLLHLLGAPVSDRMEGRVLREALTEEHARANPVLTEDYGPGEGSAEAPSDDELQQVRDQLKGLGYIG
ncbi:MAG: hypothetical protein CME06_07790 [Gemmatimonadetes bacterium]|nr:hypothetical protein [Gemmatimonadota bacterium]